MIDECGGFRYKRIEGTLSISIVKYTGNEHIVIIPEQIESLPVHEVQYGAFNGCKGIKMLRIADNVKAMFQAFSDWCAIEHVSIGSGCRHISNLCYIHGAKSYEVASNNSHYCAIDGVLYSKDQTILVRYPPAKEGESFAVPDTVERIDGQAFKYSQYLQSLRIGKRMKLIEPWAFYGALQLDEIIFADAPQFSKDVKMLCGALTPETWIEYVSKGYVDDYSGIVEVFSHTQDRYKRIEGTAELGAEDRAVTKDWFEWAPDDQAAFVRMCKKYGLVFIWYERKLYDNF